MWCKTCNLETNNSVCPICGKETVEDIPIEVFWCDACQVPLSHTTNAADKGVCSICGKKTRYLTTDLRPVFPEERLLLALLLGKKPDEYMYSSVWATNSRYYINGKSVLMSVNDYLKADADIIIQKLSEANHVIDYKGFDDSMRHFIRSK